MQQMAENMENYVWTKIRDLDQLEQIRMDAMRLFLKDFEAGLAEQRYRYHELPNTLPVADHYYDIGLSSHFLLLYTQLGFDFHKKAISEMLRVCKSGSAACTAKRGESRCPPDGYDLACDR